MAKPERLLDRGGAQLLAAGVCPSGSVGHLSWFFLPCFISLAVNPLGQGPRGNPCSRCQGIALGPVLTQLEISLPVSLEGDLQSTGRSSRKTSRVSAILCRGVIPGARLEELGWWLLEAGLPWLTRSDLTQVSTSEELVVNYQSCEERPCLFPELC